VISWKLTRYGETSIMLSDVFHAEVNLPTSTGVKFSPCRLPLARKFTRTGVEFPPLADKFAPSFTWCCLEIFPDF